MAATLLARQAGRISHLTSLPRPPSGAGRPARPPRPAPPWASGARREPVPRPGWRTSAAVRGGPAATSRRSRHLPSPAGVARPRSASARRLALGGLAVAPAGLGGLEVGLPPRLGSLRLGTLQARLPPLLGRPLGRRLQGDLPPGLRAPGRDGRTDGLPMLLAVAVGGPLQGDLPPGLRALGRRRLPGPLASLPPRLVRVRHH